MSPVEVREDDGHLQIVDTEYEEHMCEICGRKYNSRGWMTMETRCGFCTNYDKKKCDQIRANLLQN